MAKRIKRKPYALVGRYAPKRSVIQPDGTIRVEKLSPIPYHRKMVDPAGNIVSVPLAPGRNFPVGVDTDNPVAVTAKLRKVPPEWLPFNECPLRKGYLPQSPGSKDRGCDGDDGQGGFGKGEPDGPPPSNFRTGDDVTACSHLHAVILARRAAKKKKNDGINRRFDQNKDLVVKELASVTAALTERVSKVRAGADEIQSDNDTVGFTKTPKNAPRVNG